jgi:hypothetical protein
MHVHKYTSAAQQPMRPNILRLHYTHHREILDSHCVRRLTTPREDNSSTRQPATVPNLAATPHTISPDLVSGGWCRGGGGPAARQPAPFCASSFWCPLDRIFLFLTTLLYHPVGDFFWLIHFITRSLSGHGMFLQAESDFPSYLFLCRSDFRRNIACSQTRSVLFGQTEDRCLHPSLG